MVSTHMQTAPVNSVRKRKPFLRSRKGCKTSRIRHVKCDETRPACNCCTSTGRTCDGYTTPPTSDSWQIITPISVTATLGLLQQSKPFDDKANASLHYFRSYTIAYVSGLLGSECEEVILRASAQDEALYYAILAVGNVHKDLERCGLDITANTDEWSTKQYIKSIRSLTVSKNRDINVHMDVVLATCLLYTCFETLRRNHGVALKHVRGGLEIISEYRNQVSDGFNETLIPFKQLIQAFARLERQLCEVEERVPKLILALTQTQDTNGYYEYSTPRPSPIPSFHTFDDAWTALDQRWHAMKTWAVNVQNPINVGPAMFELLWQRDKLFNDFSNWKLGFDTMKIKHRLWTQRERCVAALLDCHILLATQILKTGTETGEMALDRCLEEFEQVVDLCYIVVAAELGLSVWPLGESEGLYCFSRSVENAPSVTHLNNNSTQNRRTLLEVGGNLKTDLSLRSKCLNAQALNMSNRNGVAPVIVGQRYIPAGESICAGKGRIPLLSFDMGIMPVLLHVVWRCRDARIRLRAINLLEQYPRLEGLWDSLLLARIARSIDLIE